MNMASIGILCIFTFIHISAGNTMKGFVTVQCKSENMGQYGQKSLLQCVVRTTQEATDPQIRVVTWKKDGAEEALVVFHRGDTKRVPGFSFAEPSWGDKNMNVSLLITNTAAHDEGAYTCQVMTNSGSATNHTSLKVTAKYSAPTIKAIPEKINRNTEGILVCNSNGGYPQGELRWFDHDGMEWTKSAKMETEQTEKGLFQLTSKMTLLQGSIFSQYTCVVFNASGVKEDEATFVIPDLPEPIVHGPGDPASKIVAPVVVIGSLIVGLLAVLVYRVYRRRTQRDHREVPKHESDIEEGDYQEGGEEFQDSRA
ncbi:butyrophilin subfamily 1 member A1 isoform 2-T2 [Symphorus nematophorus]